MDSWQDSLLLGGAIKAGILAALMDRDGTAAEVATRVQGDERAVTIVLEALAQAGHLDKSDGRYQLSGEKRLSLGDESSPSYQGHLYRHDMRLVERWLTLAEVIKTGEPHPVEARFTEGKASFIRAMDVYSRPIAGAVAEECLLRYPETRSVIDIGGGWGTFSEAFASRGLKVTLFDLPEVIEIVKERSVDGLSLLAGNFNDELPPGPYDLAFLANVTHIYGPEYNKSLIQRVAKLLGPGGGVAILDFILGPDSPAAAFFAVNMLVNTVTGGAWQKRQYRSWLDDAGFTDIVFHGAVQGTEGREQHLILARKRSS